MRIPIDLTWSIVTGSPGVNVWHARTTSDITSPIELGALVVMIRNLYQDFSAQFPTGFSAKWAGEAFGVGDDEGNTYTGTPWTVDGSGGTDVLPPANMMLISWKTSTGGRHGRGRTFIGPLKTAVAEDNGTPDEAARALLQDSVDTLIADSSGLTDGALGVYSRSENVFRDFTSGAVPNYFAVLRSRRD